MGLYLNPDNKNFTRDMTKDIYIDKSLMINVINSFIDTNNTYICVSRPRRFGKTMATNMLAAYYSKGCNSKEVFSKLNISKEPEFESKLNKYNVIIIDLNGERQIIKDKENMLEILTDKIKKEMKEQYPDVSITEDLSLAESILAIYEATGEQFIILMDEYDVLVREQVSEELFGKYLSFLNGLFKSNTVRNGSLQTDASAPLGLEPSGSYHMGSSNVSQGSTRTAPNAIALAYLTGILPVIRDRIQSKLNNFREYTIINAGKLSPYIGFTDDEVKALCDEYSMDYAECKSWYDGYVLNGYEIYNPESVVRAMEDGMYEGYWSKTSVFRVISEQIGRNFAGTKDAVIRMLSGESVDVNILSYMNTMTDFESLDDVLSYLIHIGYLAYDRKERTCHIPNREIWEEWQLAIKNDSEYTATNEIIKASKELLKATISGNEEAVAKALDESHIHVTSNRSYNNEDALGSAIYLAYLYAMNKYTIVREMTAGKGFADVVYIPLYKEDPALIIELKRNDCTESALDQIKDKKYYDCLSHYRGNLIFVGINYDEKAKTHTCKIERFVKE